MVSVRKQLASTYDYRDNAAIPPLPAKAATYWPSSLGKAPIGDAHHERPMPGRFEILQLTDMPAR
jgi:hypothetical protein